MCDLNPWIVAPFARRNLWGICAAVIVESQCVVARYARRHLTGIWVVVSVGSQYVLAPFARRYLCGVCAAVSVGSQCVVARCIMPTAVRTHDCVLCCTHTRTESHKRCPKSLDANVCNRTAVLTGTVSCRCKGLRVLQRAIHTSKAGPNVSLTPIDPSETSRVFTVDLE